MANNRQAKKKSKQYKTLLSVLANGSTDKARALLIKYSGEDAQNTKDLEEKLARTYALSTSKRDIEKEFAEIHPHKDFILKYIQPIKEVTPLQPDATEKSVANESTKSVVVHDGYANASGHAPCGNPNCKYCNRYFSNCEGNASCSCNKSSNACGCSGFDSYNNAIGEPTSAPNNQTIMVVGMVSVVAILGILVYFNKNK